MRATLIGATGLIGRHLLELLLQDGHFDPVRILIRRPVETDHPKLEKHLVDFTDMPGFRKAVQGSDVIFCCIGTTQKKVKGDKEAYRKVDYDIAVNAAHLGKQSGCEIFVLVSAIGASSKSRNFYLKLKGEIEEDVKATGIRSILIMRPSLLLGDRKEFRFGEKLATRLMPVLSFVMPQKYRPIHAKKVAAAMINAARTGLAGCTIYDYPEFKNQ